MCANEQFERAHLRVEDNAANMLGETVKSCCPDSDLKNLLISQLPLHAGG